jgi:hypothetical protein
MLKQEPYDFTLLLNTLLQASPEDVEGVQKCKCGGDRGSAAFGGAWDRILFVRFINLIFPRSMTATNLKGLPLPPRVMKKIPWLLR